MRGLLGSLAVRFGLIFLLALLLLMMVLTAAIIWPDGRPTIFRLVSPREAASIARALEGTSRKERALVLDALSSGALTVQIVPDFPPDGGEGRGDAPYLKRLYGRYASELEGRAFQVQARADSALSRGAQRPTAVRLLVRMRTGEVLAIERAPVLLQRLSARLAFVAAAAAIILLLVMLASLHQMARPTRRLAHAARGLAADIDMPDVPVTGATEIRVLSQAFNDMKRTIRGLMDERTRMLAAIAHDLRTYLTRLRLRADFIADPGQQSRAIRDLDEMGLLLDDTLMFARESTRTERAAPPVLDIAREIGEFVRLRRELGEPVLFSEQDETMLARCAPLALRRMLANLTDNAIRYGGHARLSLSRRDDKVAILVEDEGPGIPPGKAEQVMEPFERLEPSRGRDTGGAGLGLSIVRALAKSQDGALTLENRAGGGLRATLLLQAG
jgi:signal transduction histidine kinase